MPARTRWIVVGGGAAGCVVASRLSERPDHDVLLLEAGPDHGPTPGRGDVGPYFDDPSRVALERVIRRPGGVPEPYRQGTGLGGSSLINGSIAASAHGSHLLPLEAPWAVGAVGRALLAADPVATTLWLARRNGERVTVADAYLRPVLGRPNLTVRCDVSVRRVRLSGTRPLGVELIDGSMVDADRVVLCAGAIRTPTILLRSGVATPGVGEHLQDHPAFTITLALAPDQVDPSVPTISVAAHHGAYQYMALDHLPGAPRLGALTIGLLDVQSEGRVTIDSAGDPVVELAQLTDRRDCDTLTAAVHAAVGLLGHPVWQQVVEAAYVDDVGTPLSELAEQPEGIGAWLLGHLGGHHHVAGSCRDGVVTDDGVLRGLTGLYVGDASALPGVPPRNPFVDVIEQAERLVTGWVDDSC